MSAINAPITYLLAPPSPSISIVTRLPNERCWNNCAFVMSNIIAVPRSPQIREKTLVMAEVRFTRMSGVDQGNQTRGAGTELAREMGQSAWLSIV